MFENMEINTPDRLQGPKPRVLTYGLSPEIDNKQHPNNNTNHSSFMQNVSPRKQITCSPPYRKVRALRLFDTPTTPKTMIQKSSMNKQQQQQTNPINHFSKMIHLSEPIIHLTNNINNNNCLPPQTPSMASSTSSSLSSLSSASSLTLLSHPLDRPNAAMNIHNRVLDHAAANVNPFSPNNVLMQSKKRSRSVIQQENSLNPLASSLNIASSVLNKNSSLDNTKQIGLLPSRRSVASLFSNYTDSMSDEDLNEKTPAPKRIALQDSNISRYEKEFLEISQIGEGEFGYVYHVYHRLDGCDYAIKKSIKPVAGSISEKTALNEVWAHAVLGKHDNVVRYYSAWAENNHMLIQNEYCNGGSLQTVLQTRTLTEPQMKTLLLHIASGLKYIHSNNLVHMDLKAGNIFLSKLPARTVLSSSSSSTSSLSISSLTFGGGGGGGGGLDDLLDYGYFSELDTIELVTYKIGDLGHVTSVNDPQVEEGDCRYLPNEILREDFSHLFKADIFALGITLYEAGGGGPLPKNGPEWHKLRSGNIPDLPGLSKEFNNLIKLMTHPDPQKRPSSTSIFDHPVLFSSELKSKAQLQHELAIQRQKNEFLLKKLRESASLIKSYETARTPNAKKFRPSPAISDRKLRSFSRKSSTKLRSSNATSRNGYRDQNKNVVAVGSGGGGGGGVGGGVGGGGIDIRWC